MLQVGAITHAAGTDELRVRRALAQRGQGVEIRPGLGADPFERHHDHALRPGLGPLPAAGGVEALAVAAVEREDGARADRVIRRETRRQRLRVTQRFAREHRVDRGGLGRVELIQHGARSDPVGKTGIEPDAQSGQAGEQFAQHRVLHGAALQRVEIGDVEHAAAGVLAQCTRHRERLAAVAQPRLHGPIGAALAAHGAHHLAAHQVEHRNQVHHLSPHVDPQHRAIWCHPR